ncbi:MAG: alpha/beta fold hydrolase [Rubrivivax sp.]|nr:alpha/beta fold hydrolase [Rubrivivax sp.]
MARPQALDWSRDAASWPHAASSRFVSAGGWRWHVQQLGAPARHRSQWPVVLLLHGTGASTHSWRHLAPLLARGHEVIVPDLPGHAFTRAEGRGALTLAAMAEGVAALLAALQRRPRWVIGHSAGAAVAAQMCLQGSVEPQALVALNGALLPLQGSAGTLFSPLARWLALNPFVPHLFAWHAAQPAVLRRLVASTGSRIDDEGRALYGRLVRDPAHVAGALGMMASWDLQSLARDLPTLRVPLELVVGEVDRTLPPSHGERIRALLPAARLTRIAGHGHLMHEEDAVGVWRVLKGLQPDLGRVDTVCREGARACANVGA